jgi:RNA polymerase sigma factor (sigma-70 family)
MATNGRGGADRGREPRSLYGMYVADARSVQHPDKAASTLDHDLVESHLFYVIQVAKEYRNLGIPIEDLLSEGNLGLIEAAARFDRTRGVKFISYATWWIRKRICEMATRQASLVRVPKYKQERLRRLRSAERELRSTLGRTPSTEEIARASGLSSLEVDTLYRQTQREIPLDTVINRDSGLRLEEIVCERNPARPDDGMILANASESLVRYLELLPKRQRTILSLHYGLDGRRPSTLSEIGEKLGVSRERVRQLERQGLARLRRLLEADGVSAVAS